MTARASHPLSTVGANLPPPTEVVTDTDFLMFRARRPTGASAFNNAKTVNSNTRQDTRPYVPQLDPPMWDSLNNMAYTRFKPWTTEPDYSSMFVNTATMILVIGLTVGAMSIFLKE